MEKKYDKNWLPKLLKEDNKTTIATLDNLFPSWDKYPDKELHLRVISLSNVRGVVSEFHRKNFDQDFRPKKSFFQEKHPTFFYIFHKFEPLPRSQILREGTDDITYLKVGSIFFLRTNGRVRTSVFKALEFEKIEADILELKMPRNVISNIEDRLK